MARKAMDNGPPTTSPISFQLAKIPVGTRPDQCLEIQGKWPSDISRSSVPANRANAAQAIASQASRIGSSASNQEQQIRARLHSVAVMTRKNRDPRPKSTS